MTFHIRFGWSLIKSWRAARRLLPHLFDHVHDKTMYRWKTPGLLEMRGVQSKLPLVALTKLNEIAHAVSKYAPLTSMLGVRIFTEQLRVMGIEYQFSQSWVKQFLHSIDMSYRCRQGPKRPNDDAA
jgi:hypothetical protein